MVEFEDLIKRYAKAKRIKPEDYEAFRLKLIASLKAAGLPTDKIDMEQYKKIAKEGLDGKRADSGEGRGSESG